MGTEKKKNAFDRLADQLERYPSQDKLHLYRNMFLGAAAACLVLFTQILSVGLKSEALEISLLGCAAAIPLWVGLAGLIEYYIVLGPKSYGHRREELPKGLLALLFFFAGSSLLAALAAALYHMLPLAAYVFGASIVVVIVVSLIFHGHLAVWYFARNRDDGLPSSDDA